MKSQVFSIVVAALLCQVAAQTSRPAELSWPPVTQLNKPWTRWWWLGSGVDEKNLKREIEQMQAVGIGGVEITPLYGAAGYEDRYIEFLSPKWIQMLQFCGEQGKRLDFGVDMATGTGWPFGGGPVVTEEIADAVVNREGGTRVPNASIAIVTHERGTLVSKPSMMKVKRAAPGDEGWVLNPYSVKAIEKYLNWFAPLATVPKGLIRGQFHDSFEYAGNWTPELPVKFKEMHGYDIADHINELFGEGDPDTVARVKSDYREVLAQMHYDYVAYWVKWCHDRGYEARNQAHGAPGNLLDLYGVADVPETETFGSSPFTIPGFRRDPTEIASNGNGPNHIVTRFATSAEHVMGRQLASCETLTWLRDHWKVALSMAKPEVDQMFLAGINHILYHGTCYSPEDVAWPGWLFYASSEINPRDTLWKTLPQLNQYIQRCQSVLQSGTPDNDILVYFPIYDHWDQADKMEIRFVVNIKPPWLVGTEIEKTAQALTERGYAFDMISDKQILESTSNDGADLKVPGGKYRVLLVPKTGKMPVATLQKILALAEGGATVLFVDQLPQDVPGLAKLDERRAQFKQSISRINFAGTQQGGAKSATLGTGKVALGLSIDNLLATAGVARETIAGDQVQVIRRKNEEGYSYFIASLGTRTIDGWTPLARPCKSAVILDPLTGKTGVAAVREGANGSEVYLQIEPGQSVIVRTFTSRVVAGERWSYARPTGQSFELTGFWQIQFIEGGPAFPSSIRTNRLDSWTTLGNDDAKRFGGTARYRLEFDRPSGVTGPCLLDLGDIREAAQVKLNSTDLGVAWSLPFKLNIPANLLRDRGNTLEIDVTNLTSNRVRDLDIRGVNWRIFKEINYVNIDYKPFDASAWPIAHSGLLGPVRIVPLRDATPK